MIRLGKSPRVDVLLGRCFAMSRDFIIFGISASSHTGSRA